GAVDGLQPCVVPPNDEWQGVDTTQPLGPYSGTRDGSARVGGLAAVRHDSCERKPNTNPRVGKGRPGVLRPALRQAPAGGDRGGAPATAFAGATFDGRPPPAHNSIRERQAPHRPTARRPPTPPPGHAPGRGLETAPGRGRAGAWAAGGDPRRRPGRARRPLLRRHARRPPRRPLPQPGTGARTAQAVPAAL